MLQCFDVYSERQNPRALASSDCVGYGLSAGLFLIFSTVLYLIVVILGKKRNRNGLSQIIVYSFQKNGHPICLFGKENKDFGK